MNSTREINNRDAFQLQSDLLNMLWNNERASMAYNLLVLLTVPLIMTALIMILIEIKVIKLAISYLQYDMAHIMRLKYGPYHMGQVTTSV